MNRESQPPLPHEQFVEWLRNEGARRYHDQHPFHQRMHEGSLQKSQLQNWVLNRYYYQTRIPIKDALILSKSESPNFRRAWIHRISDHDGNVEGEGGLELWLRLAEGVGLDRAAVASCQRVLAGVRFACDAYVELVRSSSLVEAVASSLTEFFAPDLMSKRIDAWEKHYTWVDRSMLEYFRSRVPRARLDSQEAINFVIELATTYETQQRCVAALVRKTEIFVALTRLRAIGVLSAGGGCRRMISLLARPRLASKAKLRLDHVTQQLVLLAPEKGLAMNRTGSAISQLCTGEHTVDAIIETLGETYPATERAKIQSEVLVFLQSLLDRGLIVVEL